MVEQLGSFRRDYMVATLCARHAGLIHCHGKHVSIQDLRSVSLDPPMELVILSRTPYAWYVWPR